MGPIKIFLLSKLVSVIQKNFGSIVGRSGLRCPNSGDGRISEMVEIQQRIRSESRSTTREKGVNRPVSQSPMNHLSSQIGKVSYSASS